MAFKIQEVFVQIGIDKSKYTKGIKSVKIQTNSFAKTATKNLKKVALGLTAIGIAAAATATVITVKLTQAVIRAGTEAVKTAVKYDKLERGLTAVAGSSLEAQKQLDRLVKVAELPGLSFEAAIQGSINLQAAGIEAALAERALSAFGNALVTVGKGAEDLSGVNLALTQMANKTSGFGQDVRQLQERLPQMQTALKNAFDGKPLEDLEITGKELVAALVTEFEKLPKAAGGIANSIENLSIAFDLLKRDVGDLLLPDVDKVLTGITKIIKKVREIIPVYGIVADKANAAFIEVAKIGLQTTGIMLKSMANIIAAAAKVIFIPLKAGLQIALLEAVANIDKIITPTLAAQKLPVIGKKIEAAYDKMLGPLRNAIKEKQAEIWGESTTKAADEIAVAVGVVGEEMTIAITALLKGMKDTQTTLGAVTTETEKARKAFIALRDGVTETLAAFGLIGGRNQIEEAFDPTEAIEGFKKLGQSLLNTFKRSSAFRRKQRLEALAAIKAETEAELEAIGERNARQDAQFASDIDNTNAVLDNRESAHTKTLKRIGSMEKRLASNLEIIWGDLSKSIQAGFTNMFGDMLTGAENSWKQFAVNLKDIFLRELAKIAVSAAFRGIENLITNLRHESFSGTEFGTVSNRNPFAGQDAPDIDFSGTSADPDAKPAPGRGGITVVLPNADVEHMSTARTVRMVRRQFEPALRELQKRGIVPQTM